MDIPPNGAVPRSLDLSRSFGQILIATFIATSFWGILCIQTVVYLTTTETKERYLRALVISLLILSTLHEILCMNTLWETLIPKYGDVDNFKTTAMQILYTLPVAGFVTLLSQLFFTWRIWRFTNNWFFPVVLIPASMGQLAGYLVYSVKGVGKTVPFLKTPVLANLTSGIGLLVATVDILIAAIMCTMLWRSRTGHLGSNRVIVSLINAAVTTGACTAVFAIYGVITSLAFPDDFLYALGLIPIPSLYCNTVLANLNSRKYMKRLATRSVEIYNPSVVELRTYNTRHTPPSTPRHRFDFQSAMRGRGSLDTSSGQGVVVHIAQETTTTVNL